MHPVIAYYLWQAWTAPRHRQAQRQAPAQPPHRSARHPKETHAMPPARAWSLPRRGGRAARAAQHNRGRRSQQRGPREGD